MVQIALATGNNYKTLFYSDLGLSPSEFLVCLSWMTRLSLTTCSSALVLRLWRDAGCSPAWEVATLGVLPRMVVSSTLDTDKTIIVQLITA